jgi:autotransporter-associated beta strand protein
VTPASVTVTPTSATPLSTAYWYGGQVTGALNAMGLSNGTLSNWTTDPAGAIPTGLVPGATTNVVFSASGASNQYNVVLGANMTVNSLTFNDPATVTINADGNSLTLMSNGSGTASAISANYNTTINAPLVLGAAQTWTLASGVALTVGGPVGGNYGLTIAGPGSVTMTGNNTYAGGTTISGGGTLTIGNAGSLGAGGVYAGAITSNGEFVLNSSSPQTLTGPISNTGAFVVNNNASVAISGAINSSGSLVVNNVGNVAMSGPISGSGSLTQIGPGLLTLSGSNTYTGITTVYNSGLTSPTTPDLVLSSTAGYAVGGDLHIGEAGGTGYAVVHLTQPNQIAPTATVYFDSTSGNWDYLKLLGNNLTVGGISSAAAGVIENAESESGYGPVTFTVNTTGATTYDGYIRNNASGTSSPLALVVGGSGSLTLAGGNISYTGSTTVNGGTLNLSYNSGGTGTIRNGLTINPGGTVVCAVGNALGYSGNNWVQNITINGGSLLTAVAAADNGWNTTINMTAGTLGSTVAGGYFSMGDGLSSGNGAVFNVTGTNVASVISADMHVRDNAGGSILFNVSPGGTSSDLTVTGNILYQAAGGITKNGAGIMTLTSTGAIPTSGSTYTGNVTINGGTLVAAAEASGSDTVLGNRSNSRTVTVNSGATLEFIAPNATATGFNATNVPTLNIAGGTVTNAEPGAPFPAGLINNALNNITLNNGVLTATTGQHGGYAAWNVNGTITSSGNSLISTSDPVYGTVMLNGASGSSGTTTVNVSNGTLTVSAPLVQDTVDSIVDALSVTGSGTLVLSGTNTYTGGTTVDGGTVILTNNEAIEDGTNLTIGNPAAFIPGPVVPGAVAAGTVAASLPTAAPQAAIAPVPEPGTLALLAAVLGSAAVYRRLRRSTYSSRSA